jgi:hypothetical protein
MHEHLKASGVKNTDLVLASVVEALSVPIEVKKRRRGRN